MRTARLILLQDFDQPYTLIVKLSRPGSPDRSTEVTPYCQFGAPYCGFIWQGERLRTEPFRKLRKRVDSVSDLLYDTQ